MSSATSNPQPAATPTVNGKGMNFTARKRIGLAITSVVMIAVALICAVPL